MTTTTTPKLGLVVPDVGHSGTDYAARLKAALQRIDTLLPQFFVDAYAGATAKDKAAAAIAAAKASGRAAVVEFGPGYYDLTDLDDCTFPQDENKHLTFAGQGERATEVAFTSDRGLGAYAFAGESTGGTCYGTIRDMKISGPSGGAPVTLGVAPANMNGIRKQGGMVVENVTVVGFRSGLVETSDHTTIIGVKSTHNLYGVLHADQTTVGDHCYIKCDFTHNALGAVACESDSFIVTAQFISCHLGFSPFCFYVEAGAAAEFPNIQTIQLYGTNMENVGEGYFHCAGQTSAINNVHIVHCDSWSIDPGFARAGTTFVGVFAYRATGWVIEGKGPTTWDVIFQGSLQWRGPSWKTAFASAEAAAVKFMRGFGASPGGIVFEDGHNRSCAYIVTPGAPITKGQIVEVEGGTAKPYSPTSGGGGLIVGVALCDASYESLKLVVVAEWDDDGQVDVQAEGSGFANGDILVPGESTVTKAMRSSASGSRAMVKPVIGVAVGAESGGLVKCAVRVSNRPHIATSALNAASTDLATVIALTNQLRALAIALGVAT